MLLALFILTDPVLARPADNTPECLQMYGSYMNKFGNSQSIPRELMLNFIGRCLPTDLNNNSAYSNTQQNQKLLRNIEYGEKINTIKT